MNSLHPVLSIGQLLSLMAICTIASAQLPMPLLNPSFEAGGIPGTASAGTQYEVAPTWINWTLGKSTSDNSPEVLRNDDISRYVRQTAQDGDAYLRLAVYKNNTWQSIGQELYEPLTGGKHYSLSLYASLDPEHAARTQVRGKRGVNQGKPVIIRIRGANKFGEPGRVLAQTDPIKTIDWSLYFLDLYPKENYRYLVIEAYHVPGMSLMYEARVLIDNVKLAKYF